MSKYHVGRRRRDVVVILGSLIHLVENYKIHGDIEPFSAFIFLSYLGFLKGQFGGKRRELNELRNKVHILHSFSDPKPNLISAYIMASFQDRKMIFIVG